MSSPTSPIMGYLAYLQMVVRGDVLTLHHLAITGNHPLTPQYHITVNDLLRDFQDENEEVKVS
jgi:hypothetical protein